MDSSRRYPGRISYPRGRETGARAHAVTWTGRARGGAWHARPHPPSYLPAPDGAGSKSRFRLLPGCCPPLLHTYFEGRYCVWCWQEPGGRFGSGRGALLTPPAGCWQRVGRDSRGRFPAVPRAPGREHGSAVCSEVACLHLASLFPGPPRPKTGPQALGNLLDIRWTGDPPLTSHRTHFTGLSLFGHLSPPEI